MTNSTVEGEGALWGFLQSFSATFHSCCSIFRALGVFFRRFIARRFGAHKLGRKMSVMSHMMADEFLPDEAEMTRYVISSALIMKELPSSKALTDMIENQLLEFKRMRSVPEDWYWGEVDVVVEDHIRRLSVKDSSEMLETMEDVVNSPLDRSRPYWEFVMLENEEVYGNENQNPASPSSDFAKSFFKPSHHVLVFRVEHCVGDGVSLVEVLSKVLTDKNGVPIGEQSTLVGLTRQTAGGVKRAQRELKRQEAATKLKRGLIDVVLFTSWLKHRVVGVAFKLLLALPYAALSVFGPYDSYSACSAPLEKKRGGMRFCSDQSIGLSGPFSLQFVKRVKTALEVSINDVMLSAFGGAIRRYNVEFGNPTYEESDPPVRCTAFVPYAFLRPPKEYADDEDALRNDWVFMSVPISTNEPTPLDRTKATHKQTDAIKYRLQPLANHIILKLMSNISLSISRQASWDSVSRHSFIFANVPGPQVRAFLCGHEIEAIQTFFANIIPQVEILSYSGSVYFNIVADTNIIKEPQKLAHFFANELEGLGAAVGVSGLYDFPKPLDDEDVESESSTEDNFADTSYTDKTGGKKTK